MKRRYTRKQLEALRDAGALKERFPGVSPIPAQQAVDAAPQAAPVEPTTPAEPQQIVIQQEPAPPRPVRLQVHRDRDGFIAYVDVVPIDAAKLN